MNHSEYRVFNITRDKIGIGVVLLSSVLVALAPNAAKIAYQEGANPLSVIMVRYVIGAILIAVYLALRNQWPAHGLITFRRSVFAGLAQVLVAFGLLGSVAYIDVSLAALIFYLHPFLIALAGNLRGDLKMTPLRLLCMAAATAGLGLVLSVSFETLDPIGIGLSVVGMIAVTIWVLLGADISRAVGPFPANLYMTVWSILFLLLLAFAGPEIGLLESMQFPSSTPGWVAMLGAGVTTTAGFVLFFIGALMIGTTRAALLTLSEPVFAILLAILLVHEWLTPLQWLGVIVVVGSLIRFETVE